MPQPSEGSPFVVRTTDQKVPWSPLHLALFRFAFCFIGLYTLDLIFSYLQRFKLGGGVSLMTFLWHPFVQWVGQHLLHLTQPIGAEGRVGQDSVYEYILRVIEVVLALAIALVWCFIDRGRRDYRALHAYLRIFVRIVLASEMLYYGLGKVVPVQFGMLNLGRQAEPLGQMAPMMVLWAFMAASPGYTVICGLIETIGGFLLLARRTAMLGALISLGAMTNVLLLNIFYDVNQKIRCLYYVLLALYLAGPQLRGLWRLLVTQQSAAPVAEPHLPGPRFVRLVVPYLPLVFALPMMAASIPTDVGRYRSDHLKDAARGPNYGIWRVNQFSVANPDTPLLSQKSLQDFQLAAGHDHWYQLILDAQGKALIGLENGQYNYVDSTVDKASGDLVLSDSGDKEWHATLHLERTSPTTMLAVGKVNGDPVSMVLLRQGDGTNHAAEPPRWISEGRRW